MKLIFREEAQAKMVLMRDKEDKDKMQLNTELKELIRVIDHDKKLKEFMKIKTQERQEDEELISWRKKKGSFYSLLIGNCLFIFEIGCFYRG